MFGRGDGRHHQHEGRLSDELQPRIRKAVRYLSREFSATPEADTVYASIRSAELTTNAYPVKMKVIYMLNPPSFCKSLTLSADKVPCLRKVSPSFAQEDIDDCAVLES